MLWLIWPKFNHAGCEGRSQSAEPKEIMSRAIKHLLIGGLIIMNIPTATTATENKLTIVNPQTLYDPSPNGYSTAVITPPGARVWHIFPGRAARTAREACRPTSPSR
jgi:hypothetical protein